MVPKKIFFTKGVGTHKEKLASFELALRDAGIAACNLILVSSILPPGCKKVSKEYGVYELKQNYGKEYYGITRSTFLIAENN